MAEEKWEYCELSLVGSNALIIYYAAGAKMIHYEVYGDSPKSKTDYPFGKAAALLGAASWELVSVQFKDYENVGGSLRAGSKTAFFKRRAVEDRRVNELKLEE